MNTYSQSYTKGDDIMKLKKIAVILIAFAVIFTSLPAAGGSLDAHAASYIKTLSTSAANTSTVSLSWTKLTKAQQKKVNGITVFRNGVAVANLSKKASSYTDSGLAAGTSYTYQIKTYKKTVKKVKMWYNKNTKKWQTKKPAKKYRGKSKTVKKASYKYSNASPAKAVKTASAVRTATKPSGGSGNSSGGGSSSSGNNSGSSSNGSGSNSGGNSGSSDAVTKTVTDYKGVTRTITRGKDSLGYYWYDSRITFDESEMMKYDRTVPGTWTEDGKTYVQRNGVTIVL